MKYAIFFDLEGPIVLNDLALQAASLIENGDTLYKKLSDFDDFLSQKRKKHNPGHTTLWIIPFLASEGIGIENIKNIKPIWVEDSKETIQELKQQYLVFIISTSYSFYVAEIAKELSICGFSATDIQEGFFKLSLEEKRMIKNLKEEILSSELDALERIFFQKTSQLQVFKRLKKQKVIGGENKLKAMLDFMKKYKIDFPIAIGDSITDKLMLRKAKELGLAIGFNANRYAIPECSVAIISKSLKRLKEFLDCFREKNNINICEDQKEIFIIKKNKIKKIISLSENTRKLLRKEAGKIG